MTLIFSILDDITLLPWFLKYYEGNGIDRFLCAVQNGRKNWLWNELEKWAIVHPIQLFECKPQEFDGMYTSYGMAAAQDVIRQNEIRDGIYLLADLDEFISFFPLEFKIVANALHESSYDYVFGEMIDRVSSDGHLVTAREMLDFNSMDTLFPLQCPITEKVAGGNSGKVVMAKWHVPVTSGHHFGSGTCGGMLAQVHHFKWTISVIERMSFRKEVLSAAGVTYKDEPVRVLQHISENKGRINLEQLGSRQARRIGI